MGKTISSMGEKAGKAWASEASAEELGRLEAFHLQCLNGGRWSFADWFEMESMAPWGSADSIAAAIMGFDEENQLHDEAVEYAERLFGEEHIDDADWLHDFVCGALNVAD